MACRCSRGNQPLWRCLRAGSSVKAQVLLSFPHQLPPSWGLGSHIFQFKAGKPILPAVRSKLLKPFSWSYMDIVAQPLLVLVTAERKSESVENTEAALHNNAIKVKPICLKNIFIWREIYVFWRLIQPSCATFVDMEQKTPPAGEIWVTYIATYPKYCS